MTPTPPTKRLVTRIHREAEDCWRVQRDFDATGQMPFWWGVSPAFATRDDAEVWRIAELLVPTSAWMVP